MEQRAHVRVTAGLYGKPSCCANLTDSCRGGRQTLIQRSRRLVRRAHSVKPLAPPTSPKANTCNRLPLDSGFPTPPSCRLRIPSSERTGKAPLQARTALSRPPLLRRPVETPNPPRTTPSGNPPPHRRHRRNRRTALPFLAFVSKTQRARDRARNERHIATAGVPLAMPGCLCGVDKLFVAHLRSFCSTTARGIEETLKGGLTRRGRALRRRPCR